MKKKLVVLTGAGMSQESGLATFRDSNGLWNGYNVTEVATIDGWRKDRKKVLDFYNMRRRDCLKATPNDGHIALVQLEEKYDVVIVTQNVDWLHESAGSTNVLHLHGELAKACSSMNKEKTVPYEEDIELGDKHPEDGSQLRPYIVWFGEPVPKIEDAAKEVASADIFIVIGTSLEVYPAASLLQYVHPDATKIAIDKSMPSHAVLEHDALYGKPWIKIEKSVVESVPELMKILN